MAQGKQAKILTPRQEAIVLRQLQATRYPKRDRAMVLLSVKAGLRAKEIAEVTWGMVTDADGRVADTIALEDRASKGRAGGRTIPMHPHLRAALTALQADRGELAGKDRPVLHSERGTGLSAASVAVWFHRIYSDIGLAGCSSHSGRRTFITRAARKIVEAGGSLRDVQQLAGHAQLGTTQGYIDGSTEAKRRVVEMI